VAFSDPWSAQQLGESLAAGIPFVVAERDAAVVGYAIAHHAADEAEILNVAVAPTARRRGVGRSLIRALLAALRDRGVRTVYLEVRRSNAAARALYAQLGFHEVTTRRGYYRSPVEDAVVLRTAIFADGGNA
jgi:ribosomal-protein-alanine N-acetyltransferase